MSTTQEDKTLETTTAPEESTGGIGALGLDAPKLIGQFVNFVLVLAVVWLWVYRPLMKKMDERSDKIRDGLRHSDEAVKIRAEAADERLRVISTAKAEAAKAVHEGLAAAEQARQTRLAKANAEIEQVIAEAKQQIRQEREDAFTALRGDVADLVVAALEKIVPTLDAKTRNSLVADAIAKMKKS